MGAFHCPVGAVGYNGYGCINCGMCMAKTDTERSTATEMIRKYIRENVISHTGNRIKKISVCGKGGAGKSTFAALLSLALEEKGYKILLIDTDDSNIGLYRKVGACKQPKQIYENCAAEQNNQWLNKEPLLIQDIPSDYYEKAGNITIIGIGKITNPFQGCSCASMTLAKELMLNLSPMDNEIIIADQEAGLESFGRGVEQGSDTIITVVEPSLESIEISKTMQYMAEGLGIRRVRAVVSKVDDETEADLIIDQLEENNIRYLGFMKRDKTILKANLTGNSLKETDSFDVAKELAQYLLDEAEMKIYKKEAYT